MKNVSAGIIAATVLATMLTGCGSKKSSAPGEEGKSAESAKASVTMDLYVMSQCPFGVQALDQIIPVVADLEGAVDLNIEYIGRKSGDKLESMHGDSEVEGNLLQICASEIKPEKAGDFILCINKNWREIPKGWEACADTAGIDKKALGACKDGEQGKKLLAASFEKAEKAGVRGSPSIQLNGADYNGRRVGDGLLRGICKAFEEGKAPKKCANLPAPPKVQAIVLSDERCKDEECAVDPIIKNLEQVFEGLEVNKIDWKDDEAKKIYKEAALSALPAVLFDDSVEKDEEAFKRMTRWLDTAGSYRSLRLGAKHNPEAEICDNAVDDTGNGAVDCADETCKQTMVCREEKKNRLDVFVMSQCPYGVMALNAMKGVLDAFGNDLNFGIHYIASERPDGEFDALHGPPEVAENIRQLCAIKHYSKSNKFMDYIWCRNENIRSDDWKSCTGDNGIATKVIEKCQSGPEGKKLLSEDIKLAETLKIGGSPTWLANNRNTFRGISAPDIQQNVCKHNPELAGCSKKLDAAQEAAPQGSCGG